MINVTTKEDESIFKGIIRGAEHFVVAWELGFAFGSWAVDAAGQRRGSVVTAWENAPSISPAHGSGKNRQ